MTASVPEETSLTISTEGTRRHRPSANSTSRGVLIPKLVPSPAACRMASTISLLARPKSSGPHEPQKSTSSCPSAVVIRQPLPRTT